MKRSLALSGAIHASLLLALLLGGMPWIDMPVPRVIQVLLLSEDPGDPGASDGMNAAPIEPVAAPRPRATAPLPRKAAPVARRATRAPTAVARPVAQPLRAGPPARIEVSDALEKSGTREKRAGAVQAPVSGLRNQSRDAERSAAGSGGSGSPAGSGDDPTAGGERDHRVAIIRQRIQNALVYPREAQRRGIQGTSHVQFDLTNAGRLRSLVLTQSSGKALLDDASLETVERAQPFPFVDGTLIVPVEFRLTGAR